ncbi:MAG: lipopolysaccharide assembly protein LapA domain-containing protein [Acidimicrobiales bacterium]|jgi:uncharacterized integral membrane protein
MTDTKDPAGTDEKGEKAPQSTTAESETKTGTTKRSPLAVTRTSGYWIAVVVGLLVLLVLLVFILENGQTARVDFFGVHGHLPQGVALLLAAVIGGLFVALAGAARILQLRSRMQGRLLKHHRGHGHKRAESKQGSHEPTEPATETPPD